MCDKDDFDYVKRLAKAASAVSELGGGCCIGRDTYGKNAYSINIKGPIYSFYANYKVIVGCEDMQFYLSPDLSESDSTLVARLKTETSDKKEFFDMVTAAAFAYSEEEFKGFDTSIFKNLSAMEALEKLEALVVGK